MIILLILFGLMAFGYRVSLAQSPVATPTSTATLPPTKQPTATPTVFITPIAETNRQSLFVSGQNAFYNGYYLEAATIFQTVLSDAQTPANLARLALYWRGRAELAASQFQAASLTFENYTGQHSNDPLVQAAFFNQARALEQTNAYSETIAAYQKSIHFNSPIAAYIYERMGDFALKRSQFADAVRWYQAGLDETDDRAFQVHLHEGIATAYLGLEQTEAAIAQYDAILDIARIPAYRAKIERLKGEVYLKAGQPDLAAAQFQRNLDLYPDEPDSYLGLVQMVQAGFPVNDFQRGYTDYYGGQVYQPTINALTRYLASNPTDKADEAHFILGLAQRAIGQHNQAITTFEKLIETYPDSPHWADSHLEMARTLGWQGNTDAAVLAYLELTTTLANRPEAAEALWRAALLSLQANNLDEAETHFQQFVEKHPAHVNVVDGWFWLGMAAYRNERYQVANEAWEILLTRYPTSDRVSEVSFWQIKAMLALNQVDEAIPLLTQLANQPLHYYGQRAADTLADINPRTVSIDSSALDFSPASEVEQAEAEAWLANRLQRTTWVSLAHLDYYILNDEDYIRGDLLWQFGLTDEASNSFEKVQQRWANNPVAMYQLALDFRDRRLYRLSILSASTLAGLISPAPETEMPTFIRRLIYPVYYQDLVLQESARQNLDPALIFSLIRQESLFEANALSFADARGLMQIIPPTGQDIANRLKTTDYTLEMLWLPHRNVEFGTSYLRQMRDFFEQDRYASLAAYNAGPGNVSSWLPFPTDFDLFVAQISLTETRTYVRKIYLNYAQYREIYR